MPDEAFRAELDDLATSVAAHREARDRVIARATRFLATSFDPMSPGPPDVSAMTSRQLAFLLLLEARHADLVAYVQAIWDRTFNDVPTRGDDAPRLEVGTIHAITPPADGGDTWAIHFQADHVDAADEDRAAEDSGAVIGHVLRGWEVDSTEAVF